MDATHKYAEAKKLDTRIHTVWVYLYKILEAKLIIGDRNPFQWFPRAKWVLGGGLNAKGHRIWGGGNVLYADLDGGYKSAYICQKHSTDMCKIFYYM